MEFFFSKSQAYKLRSLDLRVFKIPEDIYRLNLIKYQVLKG